MANNQRISQHGAMDTDGLGVSGLLVPSATGGIWPGGVPLGPDGNSDNYAAGLVVPVHPAIVGGGTGFVGSATAPAVGIAAPGANLMVYITQIYFYFDGLPGAVIEYIVSVGCGGGFNGAQERWIQNTGGNQPPFFYQLPMLAVPTAPNTAVTVTLTKGGGGALGNSGAVFVWGFVRPV